MSVSETDIELLEAHLDGELSSVADSALRVRLASNPELAAELVALRADRAHRVEVFESLEPDDLAVKNLVLNVRKQITRDAVHGDRMRIFRYIAATAACILFSFSAGWMGKGRVVSPIDGGQSSPAVAQSNTFGSSGFNGNQGFGTLVSNTLPLRNSGRGTPANMGSDAGGFQVNLTDAFGRVQAVQHFNTLEDAREFSEDVARWQRQQQQIRGAEPVVYKDQF